MSKQFKWVKIAHVQIHSFKMMKKVKKLEKIKYIKKVKNGDFISRNETTEFLILL